MLKISSIILFIVISCSMLWGQRYERYDKLDGSNGLSNNYVEYIFEDSRGFLWFGTWDGLNRFDGYSLVQYKASVIDKSKVAGNWIFNIFEDAQHQLWIATNNGLSRYDYERDCFENRPLLLNYAVKAVVQTRDNHLWISASSGLYEYDYQTNRILHRFFESGNLEKTSLLALNDMKMDKNQNLWLATIDSGLYFFNTKTHQYKQYLFDSKKKTKFNSKTKSICFDKKGRLWIGTFDNGIAIFDTSGKKCEFKTHSGTDSHSIGSNAVSHISCDKTGTVWVCCQNGFLNKYNAVNDNFIRYEYNPFTNNTLPTKSVSFLYHDKVGNYWMGTHGHGVASLNRCKNKFKYYRVIPSTTKSLPDNRITSFLELHDGRLIIGTDGGGISILNRKTEEFETFNSQNGLVSDAITDLSAGVDNAVWIATWNGGIAQFNYRNKQIQSFTHRPEDAHSLIFDNIKGILYRNDTVWIASHGEGIAFYDCKRKRFVSHKSSDKLPFDLKIPVWANSVFCDKDKSLWFATYYGLYHYDNHKLHSFLNQDPTPFALSCNQITSVYQDSRGVIWALTNEKLDIYDSVKKCFHPCPESYGLPSNVKAMVEDNRHNLWMSFEDKLLCFLPKTHKTRFFSTADGLPQNDYLFKAACKLHDGSLAFGGTNGFIVFHPDSLQTTNKQTQLLFMNLFVNQQKQLPTDSAGLLQKSLFTTDTLVLPYSKQIVSIEAVGLDLTNPQALQYSYLLSGQNSDWIPLGTERRIVLPTLSPGTYTLHVKIIEQAGTAGSQSSITIKITPLWWQTWIFKTFCIMLISLLIAVLFWWRVRRIKALNKQLEQTIKERTLDLVQANSELTELNSTKDKLFSIIAHDLKNPINVVMSFSDLMASNFETLTDAKKKAYIQSIADASKNIYHQLDQLLNWARSQSNSLHHNPQDVDLAILVTGSVKLLNEMASRKNICLNQQFLTSRMAFVDYDMISTVVRNLITNALKFTPEGGTVSITTKESSQAILLSVSDTGIGMTQEQQQTLFVAHHTKSTPGTNKEAGTGLGLAICRDFIVKNGGTLLVESTVGQGTTFICELPLGSSFSVAEISNKTEKSITKPFATNTESTINTPSDVEKLADAPLLLIVEDMPDIAKYLNDYLSDYFTIRHASNGKEGLALCRELLPDLVLSDVTMPEMDGEQLCHAIKTDSLTAHIPVLLLTARSLPDQQLSGLRTGADDYLMKPFDVRIIHEKLNTTLQNRALYRKHIMQQLITQPDAKLPESPDDKFLHAAMKIVEDNLAESILSVDYLAKELGISRAHLFRKFKAIVGQSPQDFIRSIRLRKAAQLLGKGGWRVSEVAYEVGFSDVQHFSSCFQKEFGVLPSLYGKGTSE